MPAAGEIPRLDELLAALRLEGVPVGPGEVVRVRHAFRAAPRLDREGLRAFLACLLVKRPDHRRIFDQLFDQWCAHQPAAPRPPGRRGSKPSPSPTPSRDSGARAPGARTQQPGHRREPYLAAAGVLLGAVAIWLMAPTGPGPQLEELGPRAPQVVKTPDPGRDEPDLRPAERIVFWQARIDPAAITIPRRLQAPALLGLGLLFTLGVLALSYRYRRHGRPLTPPLPPARAGPSWMPLPRTAGSAALLSSARERRAMGWNIARFTAEDLTRRLDEAATATATARAGGLAEIRYRHAQYPREVWLWRDAHCEAPELTQLLEEIRSSLGRAGLTVRVGAFPGPPTRVWWRPGDAFAPATEDGHRDQVIVALLTDGADLLRTLRAPGRRGALQFQLRNLRHWPRLAVVDFSGQSALARALAPYHIQVIRPQDLPAWIGGQEAQGRAPAPGRLQGDLLAWAAVCALSEDGVDEATAQRLRTDLELAPTPWDIEALRRGAGGDRLAWEPQERRRLVNWLLETSFDEDTGRLRPGGFAERAIRWWRARYARAQSERDSQANALRPWRDTEAQRRWALEAALLDLYTDPARAAKTLSSLAERGFAREIERRLGGLRTWDMERRTKGQEGPEVEDADWAGQAVYLPWRWRDHQKRPELLDRLHRLGLGDRILAGRVSGFRPPARFSLAVGALAGLALAAFAAAGFRHWVPPSTRIVSTEPMLDRPALQAQTLRRIDGSVAIIGHAKSAEIVTEVPPGAEIPVDWVWSSGRGTDAGANNPLAPYEGSTGLLLLGGTLAEPIRPCDPRWPPRSLAVVQAPPEDGAARRLAIALLDRGSADLALIGEDWRTDLARLPQRHPQLDPLTQLLVFLPVGAQAPADPDWPGPWAMVAAAYGYAAKALDFPGLKTIGTLSDLRHLGGRGEILLHGGPAKARDAATGITWVHLCPGTFTQGTADSDPETAVGLADSDEKLAHRVSLSAFEMTKTEVTNAQYRRLVPDRAPRTAADLPAVYVGWKQARAFCRELGGDLPTEAQWEYAARAGSRAAWSFGADAGRLGRYAWYRENSGLKARPVGQKAANPFGLHDLHGNVWEWVRDRYGAYAEAAVLDPSGPPEGPRRVLRGGSFDDSPENLRSANRASDDPEDRNQNDGFRCVRVPARQD